MIWLFILKVSVGSLDLAKYTTIMMREIARVLDKDNILAMIGPAFVTTCMLFIKSTPAI